MAAHSAQPRRTTKPTGTPRTILVYGDLMVDRSWVVSGRISTTSQAHNDIPPLQRIAPERHPDRLGGAGLLASAIRHLCAPAAVSLLCTSSTIDDRTLDGLTLHQLDVTETPTTTIKFRAYRLNTEGLPKLS